nr:hypothetical protein CFP56_21238 [Quercus suber]
MLKPLWDIDQQDDGEHAPGESQASGHQQHSKSAPQTVRAVGILSQTPPQVTNSGTCVTQAAAHTARAGAAKKATIAYAAADAQLHARGPPAVGPTALTKGNQSGLEQENGHLVAGRTSRSVSATEAQGGKQLEIPMQRLSSFPDSFPGHCPSQPYTLCSRSETLQRNCCDVEKRLEASWRAEKGRKRKDGP